MNPVDQQLRAAMRDTADEITPDSVPPLRLPPGPSGRLGAALVGGPPRWRWLAPLAAAAAVVVIVAAALALIGGPSRSGPPQAAAPASVPPYYVALTMTGNADCCRRLVDPPTDAVVRATATGTALATIKPPRPYGTFVGVTGAAGDRTFVLAAQELASLPLSEAPATGFFLLRIDPANPVPSARARLTPLPITVPPDTGVTGLALSPDASKLAISEVYAVAGPPAIHVVTLATGAERVWPATTGGPTFGPGTTGEPLSWAQDERTVAFILAGTQVRLLDTAAPGSSLLASSRLVVSVPASSNSPNWEQVMITPDGQTIIAVIGTNEVVHTGHGVTVLQELVTFSARTGQLLHVLNRIPIYGYPEQVLWASPSGQVLIVSGTQPGATARFFDTAATAGILSAGRFTPIPWSDRTFAASW
jgi:hypothetical protein